MSVHAQQFRPTPYYSFHDYKMYGLLFTAEHQAVVDRLTDDLLKKERAAGYFGGKRQEECIRNQAKAHYALSRGVFPGQVDSINLHNRVDHVAVHATHSYFKKWRAQMVEPKDLERVKAYHAKVYQRELAGYNERQDALTKYPPRGKIINGKRHSPESLQAANDALAAKHEQLDMVERLEVRAKKNTACKDFCSRNSYSGLAYFECVKSCQDY